MWWLWKVREKKRGGGGVEKGTEIVNFFWVSKKKPTHTWIIHSFLSLISALLSLWPLVVCPLTVRWSARTALAKTPCPPWPSRWGDPNAMLSSSGVNRRPSPTLWVPTVFFYRLLVTLGFFPPLACLSSFSFLIVHFIKLFWAVLQSQVLVCIGKRSGWEIPTLML